MMLRDEIIDPRVGDTQPCYLFNVREWEQGCRICAERSAKLLDKSRLHPELIQADHATWNQSWYITA